MWDWALPTSRRTDVAATDERTPTMNANGLVYGSIQSSDIIAVLDPRENATTEIKVPSNAPPIDTDTPASPFWGNEKIWQRSADPRSVAMDSHGRVWVTARIRAPQQQPAFCKDGTINKFAKYFPMAGPSARQIEVYDPKTKQFTTIDTCFAADHNHFDDKGCDHLRPEQRHRLGRHGGVRQNPRRAVVAGMVPGRARHQRRRQDHRVDRAESADRSQEGPPDQVRMLRGLRSAQSTEAFGARESAPRIRRSCASSAGPTRRKRVRRRCTCRLPTRCRCQVRAAWPSTATAWSGRTGAALMRC